MKTEHEFLLLRCENGSKKNTIFSYRLFTLSDSSYTVLKSLDLSDKLFSCIWRFFSDVKTCSPSINGEYAVPTKGLNRFDITQFDKHAAYAVERICAVCIENVKNGPELIVLDGDVSQIPENSIRIEMPKEKMLCFFEALQQMSQNFIHRDDELRFVHLGV